MRENRDIEQTADAIAAATGLNRVEVSSLMGLLVRDDLITKRRGQNNFMLYRWRAPQPDDLLYTWMRNAKNRIIGRKNIDMSVRCDA